MANKTSLKNMVLPAAAAVFTVVCVIILNISYNNNDFYISEVTAQTESVAFTYSEDSDKVNINTAAVSELTKLKGIGEVLARRIVEYREKYGDFTDIREITAVKGIGESVYDDIKEFISV